MRNTRSLLYANVMLKFGEIRGRILQWKRKMQNIPKEVTMPFLIIVWLLSPLSAPLHRCCDNAVVVFEALGLPGSLERRLCLTFEWDKEKSLQGFPFKGFAFPTNLFQLGIKHRVVSMHKIRLICATICLSNKVTYNNKSEDWKIIIALERLRSCYCTIYLQSAKC